MDLGRLKRETLAEHERVERSMPVMGDGLELATYIATLQRLYGFVLGWEQWAAQSTCAAVQTLLAGRRRSDQLRADLHHFGAELPPDVYPGPALSAASQAQVLGCLYVMEGSTLGGQFIARHVEAVLALAPGVGDAFFRGYGEATGAMWRQVKDALESLPEAAADEVIDAAKILFHDFARWNEKDLSQQPMVRSLV